MFDGKYHGHADELLGQLGDSGVVPEGRGVLPDATRHVRLVQYNDLEAVERELARGDVACVLAEAAVTNTGVIQPAEGFHAGLRRLASDADAVLILDETHTLVAGPGRPDRPLGARAGHARDGQVDRGRHPARRVRHDRAAGFGAGGAVHGLLGEEIATGGTLFANALSLTAARVTLNEVLTEEAYEHAAALGGRLADGIEAQAAAHGLPWRAHRLFNRSGLHARARAPRRTPLRPVPASTLELYNLQRLFMANRGIWEAVDTAGPACGIQASEADVDRYLGVLDEFLHEVSAGATT